MWAPVSPFRRTRLLVDAAELPLGDVAVIAAQLLLGLELHAVVGELALAALAVLAGAVFALVDGALRAAPDILAHAAVDLVLRLVALGHRVLMLRCRFEDRALLCPGLGRNRQVLQPKRNRRMQNHGSRNTARAKRPARRRGF